MNLRPCVLLVVCTLLAPASAFAQDLPPGPGADIIDRACQSCHGLDQVTSTHHDEDGWRSSVAEMVANGAVLTDQEQDQAVKYLSTNFGVGPAPAAPATTTPSGTTAAPMSGATTSAPMSGTATPATPATPTTPTTTPAPASGTAPPAP